MKTVLLLFSFISFINPNLKKEYVKTYDDYGNISSEGWELSGNKNGYWKFYHNGELSAQGHFKNDQRTGYWYEYKNNTVIKEGHYRNNLKSDWWTYHSFKGYKKVKLQFTNGVRNGCTLLYKRRSLSMVKEHHLGKLLGTWTSYWDFKKDHPDFKMSDLNK